MRALKGGRRRSSSISIRPPPQVRAAENSTGVRMHIHSFVRSTFIGWKPISRRIVQYFLGKSAR
jgi:hypothetical protein